MFNFFKVNVYYYNKKKKLKKKAFQKKDMTKNICYPIYNWKLKDLYRHRKTLNYFINHSHCSGIFFVYILNIYLLICFTKIFSINRIKNCGQIQIVHNN